LPVVRVLKLSCVKLVAYQIEDRSNG
jgi:hypothetical protein